MTASRTPARFYAPLAIGAPEPLRQMPPRLERMIHFVPPHIEKIRNRVNELILKVDVVLGNQEDAIPADAMMLDWRGQVAEATGANIFFVKDGVLHSPTPDCFLDGITRRTVIGLAKARGYDVVERTIMPDELGSFSECFIVGTAAEVTPVSEIGPHKYTPGKISETLLNDYMAAVQPKKAAAE